MNSLELPPLADHHTFYLSSCESGTGADMRDSNRSSQRSSSSFSSSNADLPAMNSSAGQTNLFLRVLRRLHCFTVRRQKHGRYRTLSSSLHLFFKKPHQSSNHQFFKSPSSPEFPATNPQTETSTVVRKNHSHHHLLLVDTNQPSDFPSKNDGLKASRSFLARIRRSDKTVSEDNNTNTLSSLDLTTFPPTMQPAESALSATLVQQQSSNDVRRVSVDPSLQALLSQYLSNRFPFPFHHCYLRQTSRHPFANSRSIVCLLLLLFCAQQGKDEETSQMTKTIDLSRDFSVIFDRSHESFSLSLWGIHARLSPS